MDTVRHLSRGVESKTGVQVLAQSWEFCTKSGFCVQGGTVGFAWSPGYGLQLEYLKCGLQGCKNRAYCVSWLEVIKAMPIRV